MGFSFGGAASQFIEAGSNNAAVVANNRISILNAKTRNNARLFDAKEKAARGALARWTQSVNNNRRLDAGGHALEALTVNTLRRGDAQLQGSFADTVRNAEEAGRMAAGAAMSGVDGSVVDMINGSTALRNSIITQATSDRVGQAAYDVTRKAGTIMSQMVGGMDNSIILDALDYNIDTAKTAPTISAWRRAGAAFLTSNAGNMANAFDGGKTTTTRTNEENRQQAQENFRRFEFNDMTQEQYRTKGNPYSVDASDPNYDAYDNSGDLWSR